jgi:FkbM family methyltransferase
VPGARLTQALRGLLRPAFHRLGYDVVRFDPWSDPASRRAALVNEHGVDLVLDVGANDGPFARQVREAGYRGRIVSFEPQAAAYAALRSAAAADPLWECRNVAVGVDEGEAVLNIAANSSSSSLFEMSPLHVANAPESAYVGREQVNMQRLDSLAGELGLAEATVYLKVDVQGGELDVLRGAEAALERTVLVEAELSLVSLYKGAPRFDEVIDYLAEHGFGVLSLAPVFVDPADGRLLQVDAVFGRSARPT